MFPLRDFLQRHGQSVKPELAREQLRDLLPNLSSLGTGPEIFQANQENWEGGVFEIEQGGYAQPRLWRADVIILPDAFTAVLIARSVSLGVHASTTLVVSTITSATFKAGHITCNATHILVDS